MQIYIAEGTQQTGPFDLETVQAGLRSGKYSPAQLAWYEGAPGWEPISQLPGMAPALVPPPPPPPLPTPTYSSGAPVPYSPVPPSAGAYTPPPPSFIPVNSAPSLPGPATGPPKKGLLATVGTIFIAVVVGLLSLARITRPFWAHRSSIYSHASTSTPAPVSASPGANVATWMSNSPKGTKRFVTNRAKYTGKLAEHYVGFSFDYPDSWEISNEGPEDFYLQIQAHARGPDGKVRGGEFATFNYAFNKPGYPMDKYLSLTGPQLLDMLSESLAREYPQNTKTAPKASTFGQYPAEEQSVTSRPAGGQASYLRLFVVANRGSDSVDGLSIDFYGSDSAGTTSADSLGRDGGLKTIMDSFRYGN